ncbi:3-keto-5-aminohexanoate cleavage protein [Clostridium sp. SYSU_GA19001]|uniref:3-keto-5-aminohexanoate cleavage protein n=1 Tax=Clostridium caldaquaticum TaxID=2940653 RepID=UPI0020773354|nr:3-keto-5-aminohexanoate cleavage protein [Clostridium caldaquaticum]MCM8711244.1 3-keto-5-aminohexanoate cleavage protein [Clostridium caldaquaticum]
MDKVIITAALTGALTPKEKVPSIPLTPEEIAEDAFRCYKAGAAVVHLHMRDDEGLGTMDKEKFKKTVALIKEKCDLVINLTTSGDSRATDEERMAHLPEIKPEMASFDAGSFNWMPGGVFMNTPKFLEKLGMVMQENNIKPELEIFDSGMIHITEYYLKKGVLKAPLHYQFVLGVLGGAEATVENLIHLKSKIPADATWSALGIGKDHLPILYAAIALGGHVRVGLEDNIYYAKNRLATNEELVQRAARLVYEANKKPATPDEAREILGLKK